MNTKEPRVSIGLPVFNGEKYLKEALDSILTQTYTNFELIISDNASTDATEEICRTYAAKDARVSYYRNEQNLGAAKNHNRVFRVSSGEYFRWAAYDDKCAPEYLKRCVEVLDQRPSVVLCYPRTTIINEKGEPVEDYADRLDLRSPKPHERYKQYHDIYRTPARCNPITGLLRASALRRTPLIGAYSESDKILLGELALLGEFYEIPEHLFFRRVHARSSVKLYPHYIERAVWFDPHNEGQLPLTTWRWFLEHLRSINRVPMKLDEKARCYAQLGEWLQWHWNTMRAELKVSSQRVLKRYAGIVWLVRTAKRLTSNGRRVL